VVHPGLGKNDSSPHAFEAVAMIAIEGLELSPAAPQILPQTRPPVTGDGMAKILMVDD
jgi:hypothetical protein